MVAANVTLVYDFDADIRAEYAARLAALRMPVGSTDKASDLIIRFFSVPHRRIDRARRRTVWSVELRARASRLPATYATAVATIERLSESGGDLNPYQSRDLAHRPWKADPQLLEWGITHLHLGLAPDPKHAGLIAGTPDLLFVVVRPDTLYFVEVLPHDSLSDQSVFDVANRNWPYLSEHAVFSDAVGLEHKATSQERHRLRSAGINVLTMGANGRVYGPVGDGRTTSGAPLQIVRTHLLPRTGQLAAWTRMCQQQPERILDMIPAERRAGLATIELHAAELSEGVITFTATNLRGGPLALGSGRPPEP
jgi:hypothetical protein